MPTPKTVVRDPDSKKRLILEAARRLLLSRGAQDLVMDDVAREAGVAKGTLFLYYKSKEELFTAAFADLVEALGLELDALTKLELKGEESLTALARVVLTHFDHNRDFMAQFSAGSIPGCASARGGDRMREKIRSNVARVRGLIEAASADGGRSVSDLDFAAVAFIGLCRSAVMRKLLERHDRPLEKEASALASFFIRGCGVAL